MWVDGGAALRGNDDLRPAEAFADIIIGIAVHDKAKAAYSECAKALPGTSAQTDS